MKKIYFILVVFILFASCSKLEDLNNNTKDPNKVSGESLFTGAQKNLFNIMTSANVNRNIFRLIDQYWTETTYTDESNYDLIDRTIPDNFWDIIYRDILKDLKESDKIINETTYAITEPAQVKVNRRAIVDVTAVYAWSVLVETFGNIPYSEALDIDKPLPKYDDGLTVYKALITRLDQDLATMDVSYGSFESADNMYHGDVASWIKFANSLKMKMGMVLSDIPSEAAYSKTVVEEAAPNVFTSNADNARLVYLSAQPNTNPIYVDLVASGRNDFVAANTIVDTMNALNDPRRPFYFTLATDSLGNPAYVGGIFGAGNAFPDYSHVADAIQLPTFEAMILDYAEVEFLLADAAERGYAVGGTAQGHYDNAVTASIEYWGGTSTDAATYLANPLVAYSSADYKHKIGIQFWIALYNRGFEAWTEWRRYDYPLLVPGVDALSAIPLRYTFPIEEQTLNGANYQAASLAVGGDFVDTKLFWDKY